MRPLPLFLLLSLAIQLPAIAQKKEPAPVQKKEAVPAKEKEEEPAPAGEKESTPAAEKLPETPRETAVEELLAEHKTKDDLEAAITKARKAGVAEQAVLEARFIFHVDRNNEDELAAMLPEFIAKKDAFKLEDSAIFGVEEDWKAVIEYVEAIAALKKGDKAGFKSHIMEAFWLSPRQAAAFTPRIEKLRLEEAMESVKINPDDRFLPMESSDAVSLKSLLEGKKALVFHFWSPSSPECEEGMPDYVTTAKTLGEKGIAMISMLPETTPDALEAARKMIAPLGAKPPGAWLVDRKEKPLARELRVQALPVFVLVSNDGKVLFNGDPSEDALWTALQKIEPGITRPVTGSDAK